MRPLHRADYLWHTVFVWLRMWLSLRGYCGRRIEMRPTGARGVRGSYAKSELTAWW